MNVKHGIFILGICKKQNFKLMRIMHRHFPDLFEGKEVHIIFMQVKYSPSPQFRK